MRKCGKVYAAGQATDNMAREHCMLDM